MRNVAWKVVGGLAGAAAGWAARRAVALGWRRVRGQEPPDHPAGPATTWSEAVPWTVGSGVALAVARLVARRGAAEAWRKATGSYPAEVLEAGAAA